MVYNKQRQNNTVPRIGVYVIIFQKNGSRRSRGRSDKLFIFSFTSFASLYDHDTRNDAVRQITISSLIYNCELDHTDCCNRFTRTYIIMINNFKKLKKVTYLLLKLKQPLYVFNRLILRFVGIHCTF